MTPPTHQPLQLATAFELSLLQAVARAYLIAGGAGALLIVPLMVSNSWALMFPAAALALPSLAFGPRRYRVAAALLIAVTLAGGVSGYRLDRRAREIGHQRRHQIDTHRAEASP